MGEAKEGQVPKPRSKLTVEAVITRRDGAVEDLGVISEGEVGFEASGGSS